MIGSLSRSLGTEGTVQGTVTPSGWIRPSDWLTLPTIDNSEQRIVGLFAVYNTDANYIAFSAAGNYTVDWGDGTVENIVSGATAQHNYTYSSISSSTIAAGGFNQVIISVTPQVGSNLTSVNFQKKYSTFSLNSTPYVNILDLSINAPSLTSLTIGSNSPSVYLLLKQVTLRNNSLTSFVNLFYGLFFVESILISFSTNVNNISGMFTNCYSLKYPPLFDTSKVTTISTLFRATAWVHGVITVPAYDLSLCTAYSSTFAGAYNLERFMATGITRGISFVDCNLSATAINEIFTNLGTAAGTQTITVTGNRGAASCTPSIATAKGWTVIV